MDEIDLTTPGASRVSRVDLLQLAAVDAAARADSLAANTRRAYASRWEQFETWCIDAGICPVAAEAPTVRAHVAHLRQEGLGMSTITQTLSAIWDRHTEEGIAAPARTDPVLRQALAGYTRQDGERAIAQMSPLMISQVRHLLTVMNRDLEEVLAGLEDEKIRRRHRLLHLRDIAVILTGLGTALRRVELARLQVADLQADEHGLLVTPARTKSDATGAHRAPRSLPRGSDPEVCPVIALRRWQRIAGIS